MGGLCFFLSLVEYMIPKPLPFIRLGLANLPLLLALDIFPFHYFMLLCGIKIFGQALISGTLFSYVFLFSLGGTFFSALVMYALRRAFGKEKISLIGVSAAGALASNAVTLVLAYFFVFGRSIRYVVSPVLALGLVTGSLLGIAAEYFIRNSQWYAQILNIGYHGDTAAQRKKIFNIHPKLRAFMISGICREKLDSFRKSREELFFKTFSASDLAIAGLFMIPALLFNPDTYTRVIQFLFFFFFAWLAGKKNNLVITLIVMLGIVFFNLLVPYGELLYSLGPLTITSGALLGGIRRAVTLEGLFMLSRFCVRRDLSFPGAFGKIAGESFRVFGHLAEEKIFLGGKNWIESLDGLLIKLDDNQEKNNRGAEPGRGVLHKKTASRIILAALVIFVWLCFFQALLFKA